MIIHSSVEKPRDFGDFLCKISVYSSNGDKKRQVRIRDNTHLARRFCLILSFYYIQKITDV